MPKRFQLNNYYLVFLSQLITFVVILQHSIFDWTIA